MTSFVLLGRGLVCLGVAHAGGVDRSECTAAEALHCLSVHVTLQNPLIENSFETFCLFTIVINGLEENSYICKLQRLNMISY